MCMAEPRVPKLVSRGGAPCPCPAGLSDTSVMSQHGAGSVAGLRGRGDGTRKMGRPLGH